MKLMFASDIHGSGSWCKRLLESCEAENPERLILLGDLLYHGPRNDLPDGFAPKEVIKLLNSTKEKLLCVRGNCDTEVDQMVLEFPVLQETALIFADELEFFLHHGHHEYVYGNSDVVLCGHTHIPKKEIIGGKLFLNCGSVSIPKENSPHSYLIYENGRFSWTDIENGCVFDEYEVR